MLTLVKTRILNSLLTYRLITITLSITLFLSISTFHSDPAYASRNGWYEEGVAVGQDNVTQYGDIEGWPDESGDAYSGVGDGTIAGGKSYRFGPIENNYGTWGQFISPGPKKDAYDLLAPARLPEAPSGLDDVMPANPAPDGEPWVQGHLINAQFGGLGNDRNDDYNLTPISKKANSRHRTFESIIQKFTGTGQYGNSDYAAVPYYFNPDGIDNLYFIYRTHAMAPEPSRTEKPPSGIAVSLGIVYKEGNEPLKLQSYQKVRDHFATCQTDRYHPRWFGRHYYTRGGQKDRQCILKMIRDGVKIYSDPDDYPLGLADWDDICNDIN